MGGQALHIFKYALYYRKSSCVGPWGTCGPSFRGTSDFCVGHTHFHATDAWGWSGGQNKSSETIAHLPIGSPPNRFGVSTLCFVFLTLVLGSAPFSSNGFYVRGRRHAPSMSRIFPRKCQTLHSAKKNIELKGGRDDRLPGGPETP